MPARPRPTSVTRLLKSFPVGSRSAGLAQIGIDDDDLLLRPAQCDCMLPQAILPLRAFGVLEDLTKRGLPDVEIGSPFQMRWFDFLVCIGSHATPPEHSVKQHAGKQEYASHREDQLEHPSQGVSFRPRCRSDKAHRAVAGRLPSSIGNRESSLARARALAATVRLPATGVLRRLPRAGDRPMKRLLAHRSPEFFLTAQLPVDAARVN